MWTRFMDMHSGGDQKLKWSRIYIEAPEEEARIIFYNRFGRSPERVTCTCCGQDYSISDGEDITQLTGYDRGCTWVKEPNNNGHYVEKQGDKWQAYQTLAEYEKDPQILFIREKDIKPSERVGTVPSEGFV